VIFNTWDYYLLFLLPSAVLFRIAGPRARPWLVCLSGSLFFTYFSFRNLGGAVAAACLLIFLWESIVSRFYEPGSWVCWLGIVQSIAFLVVFKYRNFLSGLWWPTPDRNPLFWRNAFLPLGISFFTFEFIHYAADRYRNRTEEGKLSEYLAFILFFPTMVAGPIKRYQDFLPKLRSVSREWSLDWQRGATRILTGLAKKVAVADLLTSFTNHLNIPDISRANRAILPVWLLAFGIKIYVDFSAYSDIAIGSGRLFGIRVPENFDWPYLERNIADFWRHWHISLSSWLFDYIYVPLGGSRAGEFRTYFNLIVTMLVSGLWHGAGTNFVVWGLWHGVMLAVHRLWRQVWGTQAWLESSYWTCISWTLTFVFVNLGWVFFCMDLKTALFFLRRLIIG
jgi:alginate O-acetyltransferase complex protein AlgI